MARTTDTLIAPRVSAPDLPEHLEAAAPRRGADLLAARIDAIGTADLAHSSLEQCVIAADADLLDLTGATLLDIEMRDVRAASMTMRNTNVRRLRITGGRIGTLDLSGARIDELELHDLRVDYLNLGGAKAHDIIVTDSAIRTLDLPQAELTRVRFENSRSDEVDPRGLRAKDVDMRGLDAMAFTDANSLRGVTLTTFQVQQLAPVFAAGIGIQIRD